MVAIGATVSARLVEDARKRLIWWIVCMILRSIQINRRPRCHDVIFVSPVAWRSLLKTRDDLAGEPLVIEWVDRGWPLVARRTLPGEADGLPLGLPLPLFAGKRRLWVLI